MLKRPNLFCYTTVRQETRRYFLVYYIFFKNTYTLDRRTVGTSDTQVYQRSDWLFV